MQKVFMTHEEVTQLLHEGYDKKGFTGKGQPSWHKKVADKWRTMWRRCYDPTNKYYSNYKHVIIADEFKVFSNYLKWIESQPRFEEFCSTCHEILWSIDKDAGGGHYLPHMMVLTTHSENVKQRNLDNGNPMDSQLNRKKLMKPIIGVNIDNGSMITFNCITEAKDKGFKGVGNISSCIKGKLPHYKRYKWYYLDIIEL